MAEILLLEDEESVNRGIEFTLKKEGYEVENAGTIREAWELFQKQEPKLMICDVNLPDGSSLDLIRRIRKTSLVHVICLTAMDTEIDQVMGYEAGADDYITKPFSPRRPIRWSHSCCTTRAWNPSTLRSIGCPCGSRPW